MLSGVFLLSRIRVICLSEKFIIFKLALIIAKLIRTLNSSKFCFVKMKESWCTLPVKTVSYNLIFSVHLVLYAPPLHFGLTLPVLIKPLISEFTEDLGTAKTLEICVYKTPLVYILTKAPLVSMDIFSKILFLSLGSL